MSEIFDETEIPNETIDTEHGEGAEIPEAEGAIDLTDADTAWDEVDDAVDDAVEAFAKGLQTARNDLAAWNGLGIPIEHIKETLASLKKVMADILAQICPNTTPLTPKLNFPSRSRPIKRSNIYDCRMQDG